LWQGRFFSSALDESYLWAAIRYVERNPVRAKMLRQAERYPWSSAAAHCGIKTDDVLTKGTSWRKKLNCITDWSAWLEEADESEKLIVLRRNIDKGLPSGSVKFIKKLEMLSGRELQFRPQGRPKNSEASKG